MAELPGGRQTGDAPTVPRPARLTKDAVVSQSPLQPIQRPQSLPPTTPSIRSRDDAIRLCAGIETTMEAVLQMIEAETTLLRKGQSIAAAELEVRQGHYARRYIDELAAIGVIGADLDHFLPGSVARLRRLHEQFCTVLRIDMAALATAREAAISRVPQAAVAPAIAATRPAARPLPTTSEPPIRDPRLVRVAAE
jgi:hypothetical protein